MSVPAPSLVNEPVPPIAATNVPALAWVKITLVLLARVIGAVEGPPRWRTRCRR